MFILVVGEGAYIDLEKTFKKQLEKMDTDTLEVFRSCFLHYCIRDNKPCNSSNNIILIIYFHIRKATTLHSEDFQLEGEQ